jgi:hypothetical protein
VRNGADSRSVISDLGPDLLLVYRVRPCAVILHRIGTHRQLFSTPRLGSRNPRKSALLAGSGRSGRCIAWRDQLSALDPKPPDASPDSGRWSGEERTQCAVEYRDRFTVEILVELVAVRARIAEIISAGKVRSSRRTHLNTALTEFLAEAI